MDIQHISSDPEVREGQADEFRDEIAQSLKFGDEREQFLRDEADKREAMGTSEASEYWTWIFNQYIRKVMGVRQPEGGLGRTYRTGGTRKPGSHASGRHR